MKINLIPTYQQGGAYTPPFAVYQPIPTASEATNTTAASSSESSSSKTKDLTDKDLIEMLEKLDGLPSDMAVITKKLRNFYLNNSSGLLSKSKTSNIAVRYLGVLNQLKVANFNKKEYDNAYSQVSKNGGINEVAINDRGQFVCKNADGDFKFMTAEELKDSDGEYAPLTNSELLYYRAQDVSLANNNTLLSVVQSGIGMEVVTDMIQKVISKIGTSENSQEGYTTTEKGRVIKGLEDFEKAVNEAAGNVNYDGTVNDLYKYKLLTKDQASQAKAAFSYIYNALPENAKALLKAKSDLTEKGAQDLVQTLIASKLDTTQHFEVDLEGGQSAKTTKDASGTVKDATDLKNTQLIELVQNIGGVNQTMKVDRGDGIEFTVDGRQFNLLVGMDNKPIENTSLANMLSQSGIQGLVKNMQNITFGDQKLSPEDLKNITYNNTGSIRTNLPINPDGTVNLGILENYLNAEKKLDALGREPTPDDYKEIFASEGLDNLLNANGLPNQEKFGAFLVTEGFTTDALINIGPSAFIKEYQGDKKAAAALIEESLATGTDKKQKGPKVDTFEWYHPADWFGLYDTIYKAAIYIPIDTSLTTAARLDGQKLDYDTEALRYEDMYQKADKTRSLQSTDSTQLGI